MSKSTKSLKFRQIRKHNFALTKRSLCSHCFGLVCAVIQLCQWRWFETVVQKAARWRWGSRGLLGRLRGFVASWLRVRVFRNLSSRLRANQALLTDSKILGVLLYERYSDILHMKSVELKFCMFVVKMTGLFHRKENKALPYFCRRVAFCRLSWLIQEEAWYCALEFFLRRDGSLQAHFLSCLIFYY